MNIITPFEFIGRFPEGRRLAIVGNSGFLATRRNGALIDSHDVVARFNDCALEGFGEQVGTRTDILVCNPYAETRRRKCLDGRPSGCVLAISPQTRRGEQQIFEEWIGERDVLFTYTPDIVAASGFAHTGGYTTGIYGLSLLLRLLKPSELFLTGFSMFSEGVPAHYWTDEKPGGTKAHRFNEDARAFAMIVHSLSIPVTLTAEAAEIARQLRRFRDNIRVI